MEEGKRIVISKVVSVDRGDPKMEKWLCRNCGKFVRRKQKKCLRCGAVLLWDEELDAETENVPAVDGGRDAVTVPQGVTVPEENVPGESPRREGECF